MTEAVSPYRRPQPGTKTERVWTIADEITARLGRRAKRSEVMRLFENEGGNANTAATQYAYWKRDYDETRQPGTAAAAPVTVPPTRLQIGRDGRVVIPAEMRAAMLVGDDGAVQAEVVDGELRIVSPLAALRRLQALVSELKVPGASVVDEFLAEKREEARRESLR